MSDDETPDPIIPVNGIGIHRSTIVMAIRRCEDQAAEYRELLGPLDTTFTTEIGRLRRRLTIYENFYGPDLPEELARKPRQ